MAEEDAVDLDAFPFPVVGQARAMLGTGRATALERGCVPRAPAALALLAHAEASPTERRDGAGGDGSRDEADASRAALAGQSVPPARARVADVEAKVCAVVGAGRASVGPDVDRLALRRPTCREAKKGDDGYLQVMFAQFPSESGSSGWKMWPMFSQH
jgi:hypothetical protein